MKKIEHISSLSLPEDDLLVSPLKLKPFGVNYLSAFFSYLKGLV